MWSLTLPFEYGGSASFVSRLATSVAENDGLLESSSGITSIELPAGATLRAASNQVLLSNGVWVYSDRPLPPPPIPEPSAWALMLTGLVAVAAACRRQMLRASGRNGATIP